MTNKIKRMLPIVLALCMLCGSAMTTYAYVSAPILSSGDTFEYTMLFDYLPDERFFLQKGIVQIDEGSDVSIVPIYAPTSSTSGFIGLFLVSTNDFSFSSNNRIVYSEDTDFDSITVSSPVSRTVKSVSYNGNTYYYSDYGSAGVTSSDFEYMESSSPIMFYEDNLDGYMFDHIGELCEKIIFADVIWEGGSSSSNGVDLENGKFKSSLGYLKNLNIGVYNQLSNDDAPIDIKYKITWDNTESTWDESYKVAYYVKVHSTFQMKKDMSYTSERILVNISNYTDCESSFLNSKDLVTQQAYQEHISQMDEIDDGVLGTYINEYEHNLIIFRETESGTEYGYWNVLRLDEYGDGYVESFLKPSYGVDDDEGNYVPKEEFDKLGEFDYGQGETIEEAEENSESLKTNTEDLPTAEQISNIFDSFFEMMKGLFATIGELPKIFGRVFTFLPAEMNAILGIGLVTAIILRIVGR